MKIKPCYPRGNPLNRKMSGMFSRLLLLALVASVSVSPLAISQSPTSADELTRLKAENEKLRAESQRLREVLTQGQPSPSVPATPQRPSVPAAPSSPSVPSVDPVGLTHWITLSSSKRHNSRCRYYATSKGRKCTALEGTACLKCGG